MPGISMEEITERKITRGNVGAVLAKRLSQIL
jgi:hypothetical protein